MNAAQASHVAGSCSATASVTSFCPIPLLACQNRRLWYDNERSGRGAAWRARTVRVREVRGSNPRAPTLAFMAGIESDREILTLHF